MSGPHAGTPAPRIAQTAPEAPVMETGEHKSMVLECHDSEPIPQFSPAFIRLLNNLMDYNTSRAINRTGQVTILRK